MTICIQCDEEKPRIKFLFILDKAEKYGYCKKCYIERDIPDTCPYKQELLELEAKLREAN